MAKAMGNKNEPHGDIRQKGGFSVSGAQIALVQYQL